MKKDTVRGTIVGAVLLVLYILIAFLIPFSHTAVFWVSFLFTLIAFGVMAMAVYIGLIKAPDVKSKFYGFPIARIGVIYGAVQLVLGLAFMALGTIIPVWVAVIVYAIALGLAVVGLVGADAMVEEIHIQDKKLKKDVSTIRSLQSKLNQMASQCSTPDASAAVKKLAEDFRYSDPVSSESIKEIEADLIAAIDELQQAVIDGDSTIIMQLCQRASALLAERNRLCKLNKK